MDINKTAAEEFFKTYENENICFVHKGMVFTEQHKNSAQVHLAKINGELESFKREDLVNFDVETSEEDTIVKKVRKNKN